jgi:hypothetical protein
MPFRANTISADAIEAGTMFGFWQVVDPTKRREEVPGVSAHDKPREAKILCHCTACGETTKLVFLKYLLSGRSRSCCLRGVERFEGDDLLPNKPGA